MRGNGDGTFQQPLTLTGLPESYQTSVLVPGDFNGDGRIDIAVQNVVVLVDNNGPHTYRVLPSPSFASVAGDFNGDGRLDLAGLDAAPDFLSNTVPDVLHVMTQIAPPADFHGTINPTYQNVVPGGSASYTITIAPVDGFAATVQFSVSGLPPQTTVTFTPSTVTGSGSTTVVIGTTSDTPAGSYTIELIGTSGNITHQGGVTLNLGPPGTNFADFGGSVTPTYQSIAAGRSTAFQISAVPISGFNSDVTLSVSGLPAGAVATFVPTGVITGGDGSTALSISTLSSTPTASYPVTLTGTGGGRTHSTVINLNIGPMDFTDFGGSESPTSQTIAPGGATQFQVSVYPINGFNSNVSLAISGLPAGAMATFSPTAIAGGSGSATITISTAGSSATGTYPLTVTATGGGRTHTNIFTLNLVPAPQANTN